MTDWVVKFIDRVNRMGHSLCLEGVTGRLLFVVTGDDSADRFMVEITDGDLCAGATEQQSADCVIHVSASIFSRIVSGEANLISSALRGDLAVSGDLSLLLQLRRMLPDSVEILGEPGKHQDSLERVG